MPLSKNQNVKSSISKHIKNYLLNNNISKLQFGKIFNVSHTTVNRWLSEYCVPELELFPAICDLLNITIYEFIGVEDPNKLTETEFEIIDGQQRFTTITHLHSGYFSKAFSSAFGSIFQVSVSESINTCFAPS